MLIHSFTVKPLSENLSAALRVCNTLDIYELLDLAVAIGESEKEIKYKDVWATAIATVAERRKPTPGRLAYN